MDSFTNALVTTTIRLRYDHSTTCLTTVWRYNDSHIIIMLAGTKSTSSFLPRDAMRKSGGLV